MLFIGQERHKGHFQFTGMLHWADGENDDVGRGLLRAINLASWLHPVFSDD